MNKHGDHYRKGKIEVIDIIEDNKLNFNLGNVIKYTLRAGKKTDDSRKDLEKAMNYIHRELTGEWFYKDKTTQNKNV